MSADTIFHGGPIVTMEPATAEVEAVAVKAGRIVAAGPLEQVSALRGPGTRDFDLAGRALLPGFVEAHGHPILSGLFWSDPIVDIRAVHTPTYEAALAKMRRRVAKALPDEFLWFVGLDPQLHHGAREPSKAELDALSPSNPVVVQTSNLHAIYLNTAALRWFGITRDTPVVPGGHVHADERGEPWKFTERSNNLLFETFTRSCGDERGRRAAREWLNKFSRAGYTTSAEIALTPATKILYRQALEEEGGMPIRVFAYQRVVPDAPPFPVEGGDDRFAMLGAKLWGDGSVLLGNVWVSRPYLNNEVTITRMGLPPDSTGRMNYSADQLKAIVRDYAAIGHQMAVHAHGDRTIDAVLDAYEEALAAFPEAARPFRIEHCGTIRDDQIERALRLGVVCSFFLPYIYHWGDALWDSLLGPEPAGRFAPSGTATRKGMRVSLHCDAPMTWPNALLCLYLATTRRSRSGRVIGEAERIGIDAALRAVTVDAASHLRMEDRIGSIEVGKYADFVMLDRNPRAVAPEEILGLKVLGTFIEGEPVWSLDAAAAPTAAEMQ